MDKRKFLLVLTITLVALLTLIGCNNESKNDQNEDEAETDKAYSLDDFDQTKTNNGEAMDGGAITVALGSESPFEGTLNPLFYTMALDSQIIDWFEESLLEMDENFKYTQDGAATFELDDEKLVWTITIRDNVNWHDGEPVKAEDLELAYYTLGHPDYVGTRFDAGTENVEGIKEYQNGETESISGIKVIDEKTIEITLVEANPFLLIWGSPLPKHIFGDMDINDIPESSEVRENPIGFGPFKVDHIVPGESIVLKRNEDYWRGEVALDEVTLKVINSTSIIHEIKSGGVDISGIPVDQYVDNDDMSNVEILADAGSTTTFIGFRLGTADEETGEVMPDPDMKMGDVELRRAMWHALDNQLVADEYYHGLAEKGTTIIPPFHREFHDESNPGLEYDMDKANEILDDAGYEWSEGEEFRTDPDGEELEIIFAAYQGGETAEPIVEYYRQSWAEVGLNVNLLDNRLHDINTFYDMLQAPSEDEFDIYIAQIVVGNNPDPGRYRGPTAPLNFSRWQSDESNKLLEAGRSSEAFDTDWILDVYNEWQQLMVETVPEFPTINSVSMMAINDRVHNYTLDPAEKIYLYQLEVTQEKPLVDDE